MSDQRAQPNLPKHPDRLDVPGTGEGWREARLDCSGSMSYGDYLALEPLLSAQHPLSPDHNEMLFIIQHLYRDPSHYWELYEMAEELVDLEDAFRQWRFRHVTTVERIIGYKQGTGGTSGAPYLRKMFDVVLFPELWHVRTVL